MSERVALGSRLVGKNQPTYVIAEIGVNHNGSVDIAKQLVDAAATAGCDAVKFQKRTPDECVPIEQRDVLRETPWGVMTYMDYRRHVEFGEAEYADIARHCHTKGMQWFASCWDEPAVEFIEQFNPVCYKVASASLTDDALLECTMATGRPLILSTGMSTMQQIQHAVSLIPRPQLLIAHSTSSYPCRPEDQNLRMIQTLQSEFGLPTGYSGHEIGLQTTLAAVAMGACFVERHITLDRTMWGSDQAASVEPHGMARLVRDIRVIEAAMGDGVKRVYDSEAGALAKLRRK